MHLVNYKGFGNFTVHFKPETSILIGPNNAGKSTIIAALRLCSSLLSLAMRRKPEFVIKDVRRDRSVMAYAVSSAPASGFIDANVRHEFREVEARIELYFKNKAALYVVWPVDDERPYFYLEHVPGAQPPALRVAKQFYSTMGFVQTMSPLEQDEVVLSETHVKENLGTRLASRHFRNQLHLRKEANPEEYSKLCEYLIEHTPEIEKIDLVVTTSKDSRALDLYFVESSTRTEKEICWSGDGLQIWLQILFHIWRQMDSTSLVLDEPDVYLHPDLQRRLIHLLEDSRCQVVLATHAPEMLAEASRNSVVIVDRGKKTSRAVNSDDALSELNHVLGSGFNLQLAKALRARVALFVEGQDMRVLRNIAKTIGADMVAQERGLTVVPMGGASKRRLASSFGWINTTLLDSAVAIYVVLDRDFLDEKAVAEMVSEFDFSEVSPHVWQRKELESYLISEPAMVRISGLSEDVVRESLDDVLESLEEYVFSQTLALALEEERRKGIYSATTYQSCRQRFDENWSIRQWRIDHVPAKDLIAGVNRNFQAVGGKALSARSLSSTMRSHEVPAEMRDLLLEIDQKLS
ncbi:ATP-dependent nuclease [Amycolatopsis sp. NPDC003865]